MYFIMEKNLSTAMQTNIVFQQISKPMRMVRIYLVIALGFPAGCMVGPKYHQPRATVETPPAKYKEGGSWKVARPQDALVRGAWWRIFKDTELNALEAQLEINNQNIKQYFQNFMQARALVGEANSQFYPSITANGSFSRSRTAAAGPANAILSAVDVSWEPDLWGKVRNAVRAARYNAQLSAADLENERLSEQASLAMYYFQLRGQDSLQKLYNDTIEADKKALDFTRAQFETGMTDQIAVVEATNTLQNAQAAATGIGLLRAQYEHAIAVLLGKVASNFSIPVKPLNGTPPLIPVGIPSQLLERRPDIAASERAMAAANAQIGTAYAAFFPSLTLGAERGFQSSAFKHLFNEHSTVWSVGPSASQPIFDAGLRSATVRQYVATYNAALAFYRQNVLTAFQQVEDSLAQVRILSKQLSQQRAAEESAKTYVKLAMNRYQAGLDPYVNVVTAQTTLLTDQQAVINVQIQAMTASVQLIKALGGGWDKSQLPTPAQVSKKTAAADTAIQR
jgi:NodT family efflux transporter outer membrane factor (OMF) lipoprotein